jgi:quercetin dioxygenase-like cupin family protein
MPTVINADEIASHSGDGWRVLELADAASIGAPAMIARCWIFEPGAPGPEATLGQADQLLYVIRGSGQAIVDGQTFDLDRESVLWLEPGEHYHFVAGDDGLEILQGYAPGE